MRTPHSPRFLSWRHGHVRATAQIFRDAYSFPFRLRSYSPRLVVGHFESDCFHGNTVLPLSDTCQWNSRYSVRFLFFGSVPQASSPSSGPESNHACWSVRLSKNRRRGSGHSKTSCFVEFSVSLCLCGWYSSLRNRPIERSEMDVLPGFPSSIIDLPHEGMVRGPAPNLWLYASRVYHLAGRDRPQ
jgi:hypothetical protein